MTVDFTTESKLLETLQRRQTGVVDRVRSGYGDDGAAHITYSLTGSVIDETSWCEATAGTITYECGTESSGITTISKNLEDQYWKVTVEGNNAITDQYLIQKLGTDFYCDFKEF